MRVKMCSFLWVYYGYPTATYEGVNVEQMRYKCGELLAKRDDVEADYVAGVPDSGIAHAVGYANASGIPFARPFYQIYAYLAPVLYAAEPGETQ